MKRIVFLLTLFLFGLVASAQTNNVKVISGATLFDGTGRPAIKDAVIVIEGSRITQVGPRGQVKIPRHAHVIDATGKYIIPGLADVHNHLDSDSVGITQRSKDFTGSLRRMLGWGVTLLFDPASRDLESRLDLKRISAPDQSPYPHYFAVGRTFGAKGGHGPATKYTPETIAEARADVREAKASKTDAIKIYYTDLIYVTTNVRPMLKPEVMAAIVDEAHKQGLKVYVHAPVLKYAKEVLRAGVDGLAHGILSDPVDEEFITLMKRNKAVYIPTNSVFESVSDITGWSRRAEAEDIRGLLPKEVYATGSSPELEKQWHTKWNNISYMKERLPVLRANLRKVYDAGIPVVAGSDSSGAFVGLASQMELILQVEAGLTPSESIQTATLNAAKMVGREKDLGSVERGKLADLLILDADPLADIRNIRLIHRIVKGGVIYQQSDFFQKEAN
jgi:imidazolonepropionase-like amidohydrolase